MKDILNDILSAEKQAEEVISAARSAAQALKQSVEKESAGELAAARQKAREIVIAVVADARREATALRDRNISGARDKENAFLTQLSDRCEGLVRKVVDCICAVDDISSN